MKSIEVSPISNSPSKPKFFKEYKFILPFGYFLLTTIFFYVLEPAGYYYYVEDFLNWLPTIWISDHILTSGARDNFAISFILYVLILYIIKTSLVKDPSSKLSKISIFSLAIIYSIIVGLFYHPGFYNLFPPLSFMFSVAQVLSMPGLYLSSLINLNSNFWFIYANYMVAILLPWFVLGWLIDKISARVRSKNSQSPVGF